MSMPLNSNAWTGQQAASGQVADAAAWALGRTIDSAPRLLAPGKVDLRDWKDPRVGWGVVLADGAAVPAPLKALIAARKGPVFRYLKDTNLGLLVLRNYEAGKDVDISAFSRGTSPDAIPYYLLIYGGPREVPWELQYVLNANRCVGRLHLTGKALENYVNALLSGRWDGAAGGAQPGRSNRAVLWAVNHGDNDITQLMRDAIAEPLAEELREDAQIGAGAKFLDSDGATVEGLVQALAQHRPGLVVTTSHGLTGPLDDKEAMRRGLGLPVDAEGRALEPAALLGQWQPEGAIWYAHACCSAGGDSQSAFADLFDKGSTLGKVLAGVASLGAEIAPLPTQLLGAERPLRAFIGHVEPTFDWTLKQPFTGQHLTAGIVDALYDQMYVAAGDVEKPVGHAFRDWYGRTNVLRSQYDKALRRFDEGGDSDDLLLALRLAARDVESTVILGDPTVAMPGLA